MGLSDNLAKLNYQRFQNWNLNSKDVNPAVYMFQGDVYQGLKANEFLDEDLKFAQENLRIISGLYGLLKPLDVILSLSIRNGHKTEH